MSDHELRLSISSPPDPLENEAFPIIPSTVLEIRPVHGQSSPMTWPMPGPKTWPMPNSNVKSHPAGPGLTVPALAFSFQPEGSSGQGSPFLDFRPSFRPQKNSIRAEPSGFGLFSGLRKECISGFGSGSGFVTTTVSTTTPSKVPVCRAPVASGNQTHENDVARQYVRRRSSPTHAGLSSENDDQVGVSDNVFEIMHGHVNAALPTRYDYRKVPPTIYKVPKELKRGEEDEGYEPVAVRIGPFTAGSNQNPFRKNKITGTNKSTAQLENYKWCCVRQLMSWHKDQPDNHVTSWLLHNCLESMKRLEHGIRASYSEDIELSNDWVSVNMLLDGCFILHRLLKYARLEKKEAVQGIINQDEKDDDWTQVFGRVWMWQLVASDLLLLENQIPFFVLCKLLEVLWSRDDEPKDALVKGSLQLFRSLCPHMLQRSAAEIDYHGVHHLLHLFYLSVACPTPRPSESDNIKHYSCWRRPDATRRVDEHPQVNTDSDTAATVMHIPNTIHQAADVLPQWIPCAKELEEAGVRFRKRKKADSFLDIKFDSRSGVLEIPPLQLYDFSDKLFRNLIAFEQTYPDTRCDITTYAVFMDCLINTPEDMRILHLHGILVNQINGEQDATRFFSRICAQVRYWSDKNHLKDVMDKVNDYRGSRLHKWRAALVRNYFSNPWVAMSVLAAVLLLVMTILQTTFTVYPYFNPPK